MFTFDDTVPDTTLAQSNFLPIGLPASITPAFNHLAFFDGRMWGAERDFPHRLRFSQPNQIGISPEFPVEFFLDLEDEFGDITSIESLDDKLIVLKDRAVYFIPQGGPALDGTGGTYAAVRVNSEVGAMVGTPTISTGSRVWFFHDGVYSIDRSLHIEHVGIGIDRYFNQPLVTTREIPISFTFNDVRDEMRLLTTNYRFVYDMIHECWIRDTGATAATVYTQHFEGVGDMFFRSNGQVWWDYDVEALGNTTEGNGSPIFGFIRSPWFRLAQPEGYMRIYKVRSLWARDPALAASAFPQTAVYFNDDDAIVEAPTTGTPGVAVISKQTMETRAAKMKCSSFSIKVGLPVGDLRWRLSQWSVLLAIKKAMHADSRAALGR
jgi:hypothetical protein